MNSISDRKRGKSMKVVLFMFRPDGERRNFPIVRDMTVVGRREDCDLRIPLGDVSRKHCRFITEGEIIRVEDLGSSNGTYRNGQKVQESELSAGDTVQIGPVVFTVQIDGEPAEEAIIAPEIPAEDAGPVEMGEGSEMAAEGDADAGAVALEDAPADSESEAAIPVDDQLEEVIPLEEALTDEEPAAQEEEAEAEEPVAKDEEPEADAPAEPEPVAADGVDDDGIIDFLMDDEKPSKASEPEPEPEPVEEAPPEPKQKKAKKKR
jgi:pSer/pThr/pTyr-binding forkhead associated (FHA) protein